MLIMSGLLSSRAVSYLQSTYKSSHIATAITVTNSIFRASLQIPQTSYMHSNTSIMPNILVGTLGRSVRKPLLFAKPQPFHTASGRSDRASLHSEFKHIKDIQFYRAIKILIFYKISATVNTFPRPHIPIAATAVTKSKTFSAFVLKTPLYAGFCQPSFPSDHGKEGSGGRKGG